MKSPAPGVAHDRTCMEHAARLGWRGHGSAEPNPMVGCVIVSPAGRVVGWGYHRRCGDPHAEVFALRRAAAQARGATAYVTLEPCAHTGRTGPCTEALIKAGVRRVVIARQDPNPVAAGGMERLRAAGIEVQLLEGCEGALALSDPFAHRLGTGMPWVIAKWAQTVDGRIATRGGESRWISGELSRRLVHRERGRVDAILTGIGTILADDPLLTARPPGGRRPRRIARRVVVDPQLQTPLHARVITSKDAPITIVCAQTLLETRPRNAIALEAAGVELLGLPGSDHGLDLAAMLRGLASRYDATNVLVEAGGGLLGRLFQQRLVNQAWVFIAPLLLGDEQAAACVRGLTVEKLTDGVAMKLLTVRRRGDDVVLRYRCGA